eukprot:11214475-Ditylum_brightwellii.AAC.1
MCDMVLVIPAKDHQKHKHIKSHLQSLNNQPRNAIFTVTTTLAIGTATKKPETATDTIFYPTTTTTTNATATTATTVLNLHIQNNQHNPIF